MSQTIIALLSIIAGIIGANVFGSVFKKYSFGIIGNTIAGVFGSVFFIKSFGRLGFDPNSIMNGFELDILLFSVNMLVSIIGGAIIVLIGHNIYNRMNKT